MAEEAIYLRVTGKQIGLALVAIITAVGSYPVVNFLNPNVRNDAFTGSDGLELEDRIENIEVELSAHQRGDYLHRETQAKDMATIKAKIVANEYLIKQCMHRTGV